MHAVGRNARRVADRGFLARTSANANLASDNMKGMVTNHFFQPLVWEQFKAVGITLAMAIVGTTIISVYQQGCDRPASE